MSPRPVLPAPRYRADRQGWEVDARRLGGGRRLFPTPSEAAAYYAQLCGHPALARVDRTIRLRDYAPAALARIAPDVAPATARSYRELVTTHVLPALGARCVADLTAADVKLLRAVKQQDGYAKNTVRLIVAALSVVLAEAVAYGLLAVNPALGVARRRRGAALAATVGKVRAMTPEQLARFVAVIMGALRAPAAPFAARRDAMLALHLVKTGARPGEGQAQRVEDLDLRARTVRVERSWSLGAAKGTKTAETRTAELSRDLARAFAEYLPPLTAEALRRGWGRPTWLFPNEANEPLDIGRVEDLVARLCRRAGLPHFTPYDLRHTFICTTLARGAAPTWVAAQVGNSVQTLLRFYARWVAAERSTWADVIDASAPRSVDGLDAVRGRSSEIRHQTATRATR